MVLSLAILTSSVDRRFSAQTVELNQSEQRYRQLVDSAQVILWRGSLDSKNFSYINQEAEDLLGYPTQQWTPIPAFWMDHLHPDDRALAQSCCQAVAEGRGPERFEHRMIAADGRVVWLTTAVRLVAGEGESKELVAVMADITARKQAQEAAEEESRTKSGLLAEISSLHDQLKQENIRMGSELEITQRLQQMMLPRDEDVRRIDGLDISGSMQPAAEVGGDYYDVIRKDDGVFFSIGDVTGHGLESGVIAIMVQTAARTLLASGQYKSKAFFNVLNRVIYDNVRRMRCDRNLTMTLLHYQDRVVTISGNMKRFWWSAAMARWNGMTPSTWAFHWDWKKTFPTSLGKPGFPLGSGDVMVAHTDGITEAMNCAGISFGLDRLSQAVRTSHGQAAEAIREAVRSSLREYIGCQQLLDDISLLVVKPA